MLLILYQIVEYLISIVVALVIVQFVLSLLIAFNVVNMSNQFVAAVWQAINAVSGVGTGGFHREDASRTADRVKAAAKAVLYLALALTSFRFAQGQGSSQAGQSQDVTASLVQSGPGRLLVGVVGYGVGGLFIVDGAPDLALAQFLVETLSLKR